jgi:hypothetical protein
MTPPAMPSLDNIGRSIRDGYERATRGGTKDWLEGSLEAAAALHRLRARFPDQYAFDKWLATSAYNCYLRSERDALIALGADIPAMRELLSQYKYGTHPSYETIWYSAKPPVAEPAAPIRPQAEKPAAKTFTSGRRRIKLGDHYARVSGTCLDAPKELDALIVLLDHRPEVAKDLISKAAAGEHVSAIAEVAQRRRQPPPTLADLVDGWTKHQTRLQALWHRASVAVREQFVDYLKGQCNGQ